MLQMQEPETVVQLELPACAQRSCSCRCMLWPDFTSYEVLWEIYGKVQIQSNCIWSMQKCMLCPKSNKVYIQSSTQLEVGRLGPVTQRKQRHLHFWSSLTNLQRKMFKPSWLVYCFHKLVKLRIKNFGGQLLLCWPTPRRSLSTFDFQFACPAIHFSFFIVHLFTRKVTASTSHLMSTKADGQLAAFDP